MQIIKKGTAFWAVLGFALLSPIAIRSEDSSKKVDPRVYLGELSRLGARKPFLTDSTDVYLEPQSLNHFFTEAIYRKLQGNVYFGYRYDEGFVFEGNEIQIEIIKDLAPGAGCSAAYLIALKNALAAAGLEIKSKALCQSAYASLVLRRRKALKPFQA